jgi:hypothetical protein
MHARPEPYHQTNSRATHPEVIERPRCPNMGKMRLETPTTAVWEHPGGTTLTRLAVASKRQGAMDDVLFGEFKFKRVLVLPTAVLSMHHILSAVPGTVLTSALTRLCISYARGAESDTGFDCERWLLLTNQPPTHTR